MIYLASASPRRAALLEELGITFAVVSAPVDESLRPDESGADYVKRLAADKARAGARSARDEGRVPAHVLGADTAVVIDDRILGKPTDLGQARDMLERLSGRRHQVMTAFALVTMADEPVVAALEIITTEVVFDRLTDADINAYLATGESWDKAGGYAIQGWAGRFVKRLEGSYSAVVGLPIRELWRALKALGIGDE